MKRLIVKGFKHKRSKFKSVNVRAVALRSISRNTAYGTEARLHEVNVFSKIDTLDYSHQREYTCTNCEHKPQ